MTDIPDEDFDYDDDFISDDEDDMVGAKAKHCSGIEGVVTGSSHGYYWLVHSGGQKSFIHGGELSWTYDTTYQKIKPTLQELEAYTGSTSKEEIQSITGLQLA